MDPKKVFLLIFIVILVTSIQPISGLVTYKAPETVPNEVGTIQVNGPSGVQIQIDNIPKGTIPESGTIIIPNIRGGSRQLQILRNGHPNESQTVEVFANQTECVNISQESLYGELMITSQPPNVITYLDTSYMGVSPINSTKVLIGGHKISIHQDGFQDWSQDVVIKSGKKTVVSAELIKTEPTPTQSKSSTPGFSAVIGLIALMGVGFWIRRGKRD